jgi:Tol biopolymer transport system component/DNA-binding winged helix-turn-helix (wHTH) protein
MAGQMGSTTERKRLVFRFSGIEVQERELRVLRDGVQLAVEPKAFKVLVCLLQRRGQLVSKDELIRAGWGDTAVTDNSLSRAIAHLRRVFEDDTREPRFIETVSTAGYRIVCPVEAVQDAGADSAALQESGPEVVGGAVPAVKASAKKRLSKWGLAGVAVATAIATGVWYLGRPLPPPHISEYAQLTRDGQRKQIGGTDGSRLYLNQFKPRTINQIPVAGGTLVPLSVPVSNPFLRDVSPDGSSFLIWSGLYVPGDRGLWSVGALGGSLRHLTDVETISEAWSADGKSLAYSTPDGAIYRARSDGSDVQKLLSGEGQDKAGQAENVAWSPDGETIRFTRNHQIWEISSSGSPPHRLMSDWKSPGAVCCGRWTADGAFYVFLAGDSFLAPGFLFYGSQLWALDERRSWLRHTASKPIQLTSGPTRWSAPLPSRDGRKIFAEGVSLRGELQRYDARTREFQPFLGGISAEYVAFSKDGKSVAYVTYPEGILWKATRAGTNRVQLTDPPLYPKSIAWSPDGSQIAFFDKPTGASFPEAYVVSVQGGKPQRLLAEEKGSVADVNWSPDGSKLVYATDDPTEVTSIDGFIRVLDIASHKMTTLPGSKGLASPRWSPDGRFIVVLSEAGPTYSPMIYDLETKQWRILPVGHGSWPGWSKDSRSIYLIRGGEGRDVVRVSIQTGKIQTIADLSGIQTAGFFTGWLGLDPDDAPLIMRNAGSEDLYALTLERK